MAQIRLDLSQFKASGIYTIEYDASQTIVLNTQTTRLVVGFSKQGPINAPVYCPDVKTARRIFGDIDRSLEKKGSFFHRSLFTCLETGPCFALNLTKLNDDTSTPNADYDVYKSFSTSITEANGVTASDLYSSFFNKERFYFPDESYFLANVANSPINVGKLLNFVNLGQTPFSVVVTKTGSLNGFNVTARDWFGSGNVPDFVREFDWISDYFINVDIIAGDWTNYASLSVDPIFSQYFNTAGLIKGMYANFLSSPYVTRIGTFQGSLIPDLVDTNNVNYSIDTIVNAGIATTGLFCALDRVALSDYVMSDTTSPGRVDMVGHTLINQNPGVVDFLSYRFTSLGYEDYYEVSYPSDFGINNTLEIDVAKTAAGNYPGGATYSAVSNGYDTNLPTQVAYYESFYGSGNNGKFNNLLVFRKEMLSTAQYSFLSSLHIGGSIAMKEGDATKYVTIASINESTGGDGGTRLKIGVSHPDKSFEGTTVGKNAQVIAADTTSITVGGTGAYTDINVGDWIFVQNTGLTYYFRVDSIGLTGASADTVITVDTTNQDFNGQNNLTAIASTATYFTAYWESVSGVAGSLLDTINIFSLDKAFITVYEPEGFFYTSVTGQSYYTGLQYSPAFEDFKNGIFSDGDKVYVSGTYPQPLYVSASFGQDSNALPTLTVKAFRDPELTIGYTGSWSFSDILDSSGNPTGSLEINSVAGDYTVTVGATGFNSTYTSCYVSAADAPNVQVGQFLVSDPLNTGDITQWILTRIISVKKMPVSSPWYGYYQVNVNQRLANVDGNYTAIERYRAVQDVATTYQPTFLSGFNLTASHIPDGSDARLGEILGMLDPSVANLYDALSSRHIIDFRYIVDTFDGGLQTQSYPKNLVTELAQNRQKCMAIMNAPSIQKFINSTDPRFTDPVTQANPKPLLNTSYIATGGNLSLGPSYTYSLPDENSGSKFSGFFSPFLTLRENNKNISVPPAADVSNNFIRKFINGQPYSIVAGPRRGVLSNPLLAGLEYDFTDADRANIEPFGWNPIVYRRGIGYMIHGNQSAYQTVPSAFNNLHVRDLLITIEQNIEDVLANFLFEFNDASTRLQIKSIVDAYLDNVRSGNGIAGFKTVMDESNNTPDIISQNFAIIDVFVEPLFGAQKFINRVTVLKAGGISSGGFTNV